MCGNEGQEEDVWGTSESSLETVNGQKNLPTFKTTRNLGLHIATLLTDKLWKNLFLSRAHGVALIA